MAKPIKVSLKCPYCGGTLILSHINKNTYKGKKIVKMICKRCNKLSTQHINKI